MSGFEAFIQGMFPNLDASTSSASVRPIFSMAVEIILLMIYGASQPAGASSSMNISTVGPRPEPFVPLPLSTSSMPRDVPRSSHMPEAASPSPLDQRITSLNDEMLARGLQASLDAEAGTFFASTRLSANCGCQGARITKRRRAQDVRPLAVSLSVVIRQWWKFLHAAFRHLISLDHPRSHVVLTTPTRCRGR